jgi:biopolymer transport protein ExbD
MRIPSQPPEESYPINVTNMIDVFLLLLIFFLVATTFAKEERDARIQLPGTAAVLPLSAPSQDLIVNIREDGTLEIAGRVTDSGDLVAALRAAHDAHPDSNVLIRADERSIMIYFAAVARQCRDAGFDAVKIGYVIENAGQHS